MTQAQLPDGRILEFPDETPIEVIQGAVKRMLGVQEPSQTPETGNAPRSPETGAADVGEASAGTETRAGQEFSEATRDANEILGLDPEIVERGAILPFGRNSEGETEFAVPEIALDVARAILLPGQAIRGVPVTERDITEAALVTAGPATRGLLTLKSATKAGKITAKQIAEAPTSLDLTKASGKKFTASRQSGDALKADDYVGFLAGAERDLIDEGIDARLHPKLTAVFDVLTKKIGSDLDSSELHKVRRTIGIATESLDRDEARIARILRDNFDDFVENLPGTSEWKIARDLYVRARKAETVEIAINRAANQASGLENGLRIQFRALLNNPRKIRNFTKEEKAAMQAVVDGDFTTNTLKKIGRLSFGSGAQSGFLGGTIGVGAGATLGGPVGAVAAPIVGRGAAMGAERRTQRAADTLRALIAGVRPEPITRLTDPALAARTAAGALTGLEEGSP